MAGNRKIAHSQHNGGPDTSDAVVLVSMALVVAAIVVGLKVQAGLSLTLSGLVGMSLFLGLAGFQAWRRSLAERDALAGELERLEAEMGRLKTQPDARARLDRIASRPSVPAEGAAVRAEPAAAGAAFEPSMPPVQAGAVPPLPPQLGGRGPSAAERAAGPEDEPELPPQASSAVREDDVEMLQRRIKEMLYQVTAAEQARETAGSEDALQTATLDQKPVAAMGIEASLGALKAAAQTMRNATPRGQRSGLAAEPVRLPPAGVAVAAEVPALPEPATPPDPQLVAVREAIEAGRVDVFLEPILGLGDQAAQHYEVSIKIRGGQCEDLGTGEGDVVAGRGLLPLFDSARVQRSAIVAERLTSRGKTGSVFSHASGEALIEPAFTRDMQSDFSARPATARQLVLTFEQADIRGFRAAEQRAVSVLSSLGFRFAISGLTDLDMNFEAMARAGFGFVKLDAKVLTEGLAHPGGHIPASDVCRFLAEQGFGLIVEGIDSEDTLAKVFGFGVLLGQGSLFGGRRPVRADVVARPGQAAA